MKLHSIYDSVIRFRLSSNDLRDFRKYCNRVHAKPSDILRRYVRSCCAIVYERDDTDEDE